jgi:hypothetical protein
MNKLLVLKIKAKTYNGLRRTSFLTEELLDSSVRRLVAKLPQQSRALYRQDAD